MALADRFFIVAILFALTGMVLGIWMGMTGEQEFNYGAVHAHINLVGWATLFLCGLWYRGQPQVRGGWAEAHFWTALVGAILLVIGVLGAVVPNETLDLAIIPGSLLTLLAMLIFLVIVVRNRSA